MMCLFLFEVLMKTSFQYTSNKSKPLFLASGIKQSVHDCHLKESLIRENPWDPWSFLKDVLSYGRLDLVRSSRGWRTQCLPRNRGIFL